ncbi:AAC(3) family N-acetyltransferase [Maridesulfovibrio sp.]|uniref:AAC(3) family N-acetyltransferase n=1 Tax=Maridesulfovibrio sp. TaxID=2795000 RepID=UPI0029CA9EDF|nr:AAC(3) family N-acetyltransferase [Maridesulfovibrio sp.]
MLLSLYRKLAYWAYEKYTPQRARKAAVEASYKQSRGYNQSFETGSIDPAIIAPSLAEQGLKPSDTIFIRTSLTAASAFRGGVVAYLKALMEYFKDGNIVMASYTFDKGPIMYLAENPLFDPDKTVDRLNLVSEFFRRQPDVYRSIHPTHSLVAWGKDASWLVADHHKSDFCYAPDSPVARLYHLNAKELSVGVYPTSVSYHYVEQFIPKNAPGFHDLDIPIMCRVMIDGKEELLPFKETDAFARFQAHYKVLKGTDAQPQKHLFDNKLDFYTLDLNKQLATMKDLVASKRYWHTEPSRLKNIIFKNVIKPLILLAFFDKRNNALYPVKGPES